MATQQLPQNPYQDYLHASQDYWLAARDSMDPPPPTYRTVNGEQKLGRYVDPFGAAGLMQSSKDEWGRWYPSFLVGSAVGPMLTGVGWVFVVLVAPFLAAWYLIKRSYYRRQYDSYYKVLQEIQRTGEAVWVAYDKARLDLISKRQQAVWP